MPVECVAHTILLVIDVAYHSLTENISEMGLFVCVNRANQAFLKYKKYNT